MTFDTLSIGVNFCLHSDMQYSADSHCFSSYMFCVSVVLGVRCHLTKPEVTRVIQMLEDGFSQRDVAAAYGVR